MTKMHSYEIHIRRHDGKEGIYNLTGTEADALAEVTQHKRDGFYAWFVIAPQIKHMMRSE